MYFDFEDYRPDYSPVGRALTRLEVVIAKHRHDRPRLQRDAELLDQDVRLFR